MFFDDPPFPELPLQCLSTGEQVASRDVLIRNQYTVIGMLEQDMLEQYNTSTMIILSCLYVCHVSPLQIFGRQHVVDALTPSTS